MVSVILGLVLAVLVFALAGVFYLARHAVIRGTAHGSPRAQVPPSPDYELVDFHPKDGTKIVAQFGRAMDVSGTLLPADSRRATLVYCYPGGGTLRWSAPQFEEFQRLGVNVVMPEYPGFGLSAGRASEAGCYAAAEAAYDYVRGRTDLSAGPIIAAGWSLGGACAVDLASRRAVAGLIMFDTLPNWSESALYFTGGGAARLPGLPPAVATALRWLPGWAVRLLAAEPKLDSRAKIGKVSAPILMVYGTESELISPAMLERLAGAATAKVTRLPVEGAGHFDLFSWGGVRLGRAVGDWIAAIVRAPPAPLRHLGRSAIRSPWGRAMT